MEALILLHARHEGPGHLGNALEDAGARARVFAFHDNPLGRPELGDAEVILSMGGPMGAADEALHPWIRTEMDLLARAVREGKKVLGVCLGAQLLARALGGGVHRTASPEIGFTPITLSGEGRDDPVLAGLKPTETVLHWHQDGIDLPPGGVLLASSAASPHQAFRVGRHAYGLQFHLEVGREMLEGWLRNPDVTRELQAAPAAPSPDGLLAAAAEHEKRLSWLCCSVVNRLINLM